MTIKQKNPGWLAKVLKSQKKMTESRVAIGFPKGTEAVSNQYPDGTAVLDVAFWNNFGTRRTPRRDFMTAGLKEAIEKTAPIAKASIKNINAGKISANKVLDRMGLVGASQIQLAIRNLREPPNAQSTIDAKRSSNPLVDTGFMIQSVTHSVRKATE